MHTVETLIVGAGQAGLAVSRCLTGQGADHVVVERGRIAERWRSARWDSLRLLTPNWMSRLPAWSYPGPDPDGYMAAPELASYLEGYAGSFTAPVYENTTVELVEASGDGLRVVTDQRTWLARNVVVATGTENRAYVPPAASGIDPGIYQLTASRYRGPDQVPGGGVLVVGASASGVQIADELRRAGRPVVVSVGRHARVPRRYRGRDILWWMDRAGVLGQTIDQVHDARSARRAPSLQLSGRSDRVGLEPLAAGGVRLAGRLVAADGQRLSFADDLPTTIGGAQARMERLLRTIDGYIAHSGGEGPADPPAPFTAPAGPVRLDLRRAGISTVIWATGYRPAYPWLRVPILDRHGEIAHHRGVTSVPGLYVLGLKFLHRRNSTFVDGVASDARFVAAHLKMRRMTARALAAADLDTRDLSA
ncbi:MAG TPA: NAD(P)-binding domain-containing protein [Streptosporangiaceae bacterium]|nr:NAD(P)-binding domain-containing protein [Streptosporangiaceae bacterium]